MYVYGRVDGCKDRGMVDGRIAGSMDIDGRSLIYVYVYIICFCVSKSTPIAWVYPSLFLLAVCTCGFIPYIYIYIHACVRALWICPKKWIYSRRVKIPEVVANDGGSATERSHVTR